MASHSRYMLYKKVARGGMAEIYLGKQFGKDGFQRICCIKRILPHFAQDKEFIEMFRDEAHICKRLQHANIVRVEGFEEVQGSYAIIMEFINGGDLRYILSCCEKKSTVLTIPMVLYIISEAARGLHYAHKKRDDLTGKPMDIVHRDISPQNILISFEGEVKVTDFGIADADNKDTETKPGIVKGKYSYMSPEQISAKSVDARTDVFALSIVLWEMLAMKRLFQGSNEANTIRMVQTCQINEDLRSINPNVDDALYKIVKKGLSKNPKDRYASAAELDKILRKYINSNFSDFTVSDLADFLKKILNVRMLEMQAEVKKLLSMGPGTNLNLKRSPQETRNNRQRRHQPERMRDFRGRINSGNKSYVQRNTNNTNMTRQRSNSVPNQQKRYARGGNRKIESRKTSFRTYLFFFCILAIVAYFNKDSLFSPLGTVQLQFSPSTVRLSLNGQSIFKNKYVKSPIELVPIKSKGKNQYVIKSYFTGKSDYFKGELLTLNKKATHSLKIKRSGYKNEVFTFTLKKSIKKVIVLEKIVDMAPTRIFIKGTSKKVWVKIDDGEVTDVATGIFDAEDIIFGKDHRLFLYPLGLGNKRGSFYCTFRPRAKNWGAPFLIHADIRKKRCTYPPK